VARYTTELIASVRHDYENTDKSLHKIARDHEISTRGVHRLRDRGGWARRSERVRDLPPAMQALREATALLTGTAVGSPPPCGEELGVGVDRARPALPPSPTLPHKGGGSGEPVPASPHEGERIATIERIERLVQRELEAEEMSRAQLGPLPRQPADAERCARTLATLTQTLHALARLRSGLFPESGLSDDDMPRDIDEFRRELARRIRVFVQSRTGGRLRDGVPAAGALDGEP
jgi:hypothetical protein